MKLQLVAKNFKKIEGGTLWRHEKISEKFFNEIFEQCHSAEKCKRGTLYNFLTSIVLENIKKKLKGGPFGEKFQSKKFQKVA